MRPHPRGGAQRSSPRRGLAAEGTQSPHFKGLRPKASLAVTGGQGVDYAFDAIGDSRVSRMCYDAVRRGGTAVIVGMAPTGSEISIPSTISGEEKIVKGCFYGSSRPAVDFPRLVDFYLRGLLPLDRMITRTYPLNDINAAFEALGRGDNARGVITPTN